MGYEFRPAVRDNASVIIGLSGASGSGKTLSALILATGLAGPTGRIAYIDTERGRALHYAPAPGVPADPSKGTFAFHHAELNPPFSPARYLEAIKAADEAGFGVIVVDSTSHEWEGEGGVLDMQEIEFQRLGGRDSVKMKSWITPKGEHKKMVNRAIQSRAHLVLCFRAQEKVKIVKGPGGKQEIIQASDRPVAERWEPICEKRLPYELTVSLVLTPSDPGVPVPLKLQAQHRPFFPEGRKIDLAAGAGLAAWSAGRTSAAAPPAIDTTPDAGTDAPLTRGEVRQLEQLLDRAVAAGTVDGLAADLHRVAIEKRDAAKVREGIRELSAKVAA